MCKKIRSWLDSLSEPKRWWLCVLVVLLMPLWFPVFIVCGFIFLTLGLIYEAIYPTPPQPGDQY